jgi:hypothetical protein
LLQLQPIDYDVDHITLFYAERMVSTLDMNLPIRWRDEFFSFAGEADIRLVIHCNDVNDGQIWRLPQDGFQVAKGVERIRPFMALTTAIDRDADVAE